MVSTYLWVRKTAVMPGDKRGHAPRQLVLSPQTAFFTLRCSKCRLVHPHHLLPSLPPSWPPVVTAAPPMVAPVGGLATSGIEGHCDRSWGRGDTGLVVLVGGAVKPPSFHAPLALMCTHARGLLKAIQTASWWDHSRFPSHVLTPQTLCPLPSSKTNNVGDISAFFLH